MIANIPYFGLGTYKLNKDTAYTIVKSAIKLGYRHFDTATVYRNEEAVGRAIKDSDVKRNEIFLCTKIWIDKIKDGEVGIMKSVNDSLKKLGMEYVDLVLLHAPVKDHIVDSWRILEKLYTTELKDKVRFIGVSNYEICHLEQLKECKITPYVNQIEITPFLKREKLVKYCNENKIRIVAHSSLTQGIKLNDPVLIKIAEKYTVTVATLLIKWALTKGYTVLPRTSNIEHLEENLNTITKTIEKNALDELDNINETFIVMPKYII